MATENTLPQPTTGLIQATYVAGEKEGAITITIYSIYGSFTNDVVLALSGWTDLDQDGFIDQFTVEPSMGSILSLAPMTANLPPTPPCPGRTYPAPNLRSLPEGTRTVRPLPRNGTIT